MVWADSRRISRALRYLGVQILSQFMFLYTRLSLSMVALSRAVQLTCCKQLKTSISWSSNPATPVTQRMPTLTRYKFGLFPFRSPLLRKSLRFLFLALLRCFSSCRSLLYPMCSGIDDLGLPDRVSPFGNLRIKTLLTAPRSIWPSHASFIASWYQGIHQKPFSINH